MVKQIYSLCLAGNGKIFYTSFTSLSHMSKKPGHEAYNGELNVKNGKEKHSPDGNG